MEIIATLLFFAVLLTPIGLIIGFLLWLGGTLAKGQAVEETPAQWYGRKIMLWSVVAFMVGMGSCWGLIGLQSVLDRIV